MQTTERIVQLRHEYEDSMKQGRKAHAHKILQQLDAAILNERAQPLQTEQSSAIVNDMLNATGKDNG